MDLASFGIQQIEVFVLVLARTAGIFTMTPIFGTSQVPVQVRLGISLALTMVFMPLCNASTHMTLAVEVLPMMLLIAKETLIGLVIGFVVMLVFTAIQSAGDYIDLVAGFSFATMFDPVTGTQTAIASRFHYLLAGMLFFAINAHHIFLSGVADSFRLIPVGQMSLNPVVATGAVNLFVGLFTIAIRIAAPVVAAVFMADVALAVISRAMPQMNTLMAGLPLKLGIGLVGMLIALPVSIALSRGAFGDIQPQTVGLLKLLISH
ncbi:MAG: flagellar biosynthetic protein FliR [Armatimonadota bacterium]